MAAHSDEEDFVPVRRQSRQVEESGSGSGSDEDFVPVRAHKTSRGGDDSLAEIGKQLSGKGDGDADAQIEKAKSVLNDKEKLQNVIHELAKEKDGFQKAIESVEKNSNLKRKAMRVANNPEIRNQVSSMSLKQKRKLQKQYEKFQKSSKLPSMEGEGYKGVSVTLSGKLKNVTILGPDFLAGETYSGWSTQHIKDDIYITFDPAFLGPNKHVTKLLGQKITDKHVFYRMMDEQQLTHMTLEEFVAAFPEIKKGGKVAAAPEKPAQPARPSRKSSRHGRH